MNKETNLTIFLIILIITLSFQVIAATPPTFNNNGWALTGPIGDKLDLDSGFVIHNGNLIVIKESGKTYKYNKNNNTWTTIGGIFPEGTLSGTIKLAKSNGKNIFIGGSSGEVFYSKDGKLWSSAGIPSGSYGNHIHSMTIFKNSLYIGCYDGTVYKYLDKQNWQNIGIPGDNTYDLLISDLVVYKNQIYASKIAGPEYNSKGSVYKYVGGTSWQFVGFPDPTPYSNINDLEIFNNELVAVSQFGVVSKFNNVNKWTLIIDQPTNNYWSLNSMKKRLHLSSNKLYFSTNLNTWVNAGSPGLVTYLGDMIEYNNKIFVIGYNSMESKVYTYTSR